MFVNPNNPAEDTVRDEQAAARAIGQHPCAEASTEREIELAFATIARHGADALLVNADSSSSIGAINLSRLAARHRYPLSYAGREYAGRAA